MASHLLFQATNGMDIGAVSMMLYGWREREEVLRLLEYDHRPADEPQLHPPRRRRGRPARRLAGATSLELCDIVEAGIDEYDDAAHREPDLARAHRRRRRASPPRRPRARHHRPDPALDRVRVGPAQGAAVPRVRRGRLRRHLHRERRLFDRYQIRLYEIRESIKIVRQCVERMPQGDYRMQDKKVTPPPRARIDESMEALIHHFKLFTEGFRVPAGETYVGDRVAARRDRLLPRVRRHREAGPPAHPRARRSTTCSRWGRWCTGSARGRRGRDRLERRPDHGRGRPMMLRSPPRTATARRARSSPATRAPKSAILPLLHLAQDQDGWVAPDAIEEIAELVGLDARRGARDVQLLHDVQARAVRHLVVSVCTNVTCLVNGGPELFEHLEAAVHGRRTTSWSKRSSASPPATPRRSIQVNYEFHGSSRREVAERRRSRSTGRVARRPHGLRRVDRATRAVPPMALDRDARIVTQRLRELPDDSWTIDAALAHRRATTAAQGAGHGDPRRDPGAGEGSGLRGRGGAGFATGQKWSFLPEGRLPARTSR